MKKKASIDIQNGEMHMDDRGKVQFVNTFDFKGVKRFYQVENWNTNIIRAFHGHKKEGKYVYVSAGSLLLCTVEIDNFENPSKSLTIKKTILSSQKPQVIFIPPGYANGFKFLEKNTKVLFFSTSTLEASLKDDFRFPFDYWGEEIWQTKNR